MIQLQKAIKVGPTVVPAGTVLYNKFQSNVVYYKGTKIEIDKIPAEAIFAPVYQETATEAYVPGKHKLMSGIEAKIGDHVEVVDYNYDANGHTVAVAKGTLQAYGTFAKYEEDIKKAGKAIYDAIKAAVKSARNIVWCVNNKWFTADDGKYGIEDAGLQIVPAEGTANTDNIMFNGAVVARVVSPALAKASYPDVGYLNSKEHQITVLNNNDEVIELKCIKSFAEDDDTAESEIVMAQDILNELAPILSANESLTSELQDFNINVDEDSSYDEVERNWSSLQLAEIRAICNMLSESFNGIALYFRPYVCHICIFDETGDGTNPICVVELQQGISEYNFLARGGKLAGNIQIPTTCNFEAMAIVRKIIDIAAPSYICVSSLTKYDQTKTEPEVTE